MRLASTHKVPLFYGRPGPSAVKFLNSLDIDLFVSAAYSYRIPIEDISTTYSLNMHPSLLPDGRGPNPLPYLLDSQSQHAGLSLHVLTSDFDAGAVVAQMGIEGAEKLTFDELSLRMFAAAPILLASVIADLSILYRQAVSQSTGSYWPAHDEADRTIVATDSTVAQAVEASRRFGPLGVLVDLGTQGRFEAREILGVTCDHAFKVGTVASIRADHWIVAVSDGILRLSGTSENVHGA